MEHTPLVANAALQCWVGKTKNRRGPITASTLKSRDRNNLQRGELIVIGLERGAALDLLIWLLRLAGPALVWLAWLLCLGWPGSSGWVALAWFGWPGCSGLVGLAPPAGWPWPGLAVLAGSGLVGLAPPAGWPCGNRCVYWGEGSAKCWPCQ